MNKLDAVVNRINNIFSNYVDVKWKFGSVAKRPTKEQINDMVRAMSSQVGEEESVTCGGIHIQKYPKHTDVYVFVGDLESPYFND